MKAKVIYTPVKPLVKAARSFIHIFNIRTLILLSLSLCGTYLCLYFNIMADLPQTVIGIAIVFPIVFSIGSAYQRRENALKEYSNLKAHSRSIYFAVRDWFEEENPEQLEEVRNLLESLLISIRNLLAAKTKKLQENEPIVYENFSKLSIYIKQMRMRGMTPGELSRVNQYLSKMLDAFESLKHIYQYRTPITLRAYSRIFIFVIPILYAPYFAFVGKNIPLMLAMITPFLTSIVFAGLDNIQDDLEKPFDQIGTDDIYINAEKVVHYMN